MKDIARQLSKIVETAAPQLSRMNSDNIGLRPSPNEWSKKEILGHLIDSAANNHQRIVRAVYRAAHHFPAYDQNKWIEIQHYNEMSWVALVAFWVAYNNHLSHVISHSPKDAESCPCNIGKDERVPLEGLVKDYLRHLRLRLDDLMVR